MTGDHTRVRIWCEIINDWILITYLFFSWGSAKSHFHQVFSEDQYKNEKKNKKYLSAKVEMLKYKRINILKEKTFLF